MPLTSVPLPSILDMLFVLKNQTNTHNLACVTKVKIIPSVSLEFHELYHPPALRQRKSFQAVLLVNEFSPLPVLYKGHPAIHHSGKTVVGRRGTASSWKFL